ncbi:MAG: GNAT family N-acetyltransferase [Deinococcota bacterium]
MMRVHVEFERGTDFRLTEAELLSRGFGPSPEFGAFVADRAQSNAPADLVGMAVYYEIPFMHTLRPYLMLKWLHVDPKARGIRIGEQLMRALASHAVETGHDQISWFVLPDNVRAQSFYQRLGASEDPKWKRWTLPPSSLRKLSSVQLSSSVFHEDSASDTDLD